MTIIAFQLTSYELDEIVASYGLVEEVSENKTYLQESIDLAMEVSDCPAAYISILDSKNQHIITSEGITEFPLQRNQSVCQITVNNSEPTIIEDLSTDSRLCNLKIDKTAFNFYAGFPLINSEGVAIGALCLTGNKTKTLDDKKIRIIEMIARAIISKFDNRRNLIKLIKDINKNFKPAACADFNCLAGELAHLQQEVMESSEKMKAQQEELKSVNKNLSQFAHRIAHDLKAPLRSINGFTQLIKKQIDRQNVDYDPSQFDIVKTSTNQLYRMIDNVLSIAEMKSNVIREKVSISEILDKVEMFLSDSITTNSVKLIKPDQDVQVTGYKDLLHQLFQNIIANAIKYRDIYKESIVSVTFEPLETKVLVKITDNGIGISSENLDKILQPFKRVNDDKEIAGLGIGLDTCSVIVQDMGSELKVDSRLGLGTTFSFEIPYDDNSAIEQQTTRQA